MRIWDVEPKVLCRQHLLGEHRELHGLWNILVMGKKGYSKHPETVRWQGKLKALYFRHSLLADEIQARGYNHTSPLDKTLATGLATQKSFINSPDEQLDSLRHKPCDCLLGT